MSAFFRSAQPDLRLAAIVLLSLFCHHAWGHAAHGGERRATLDPLPASLHGITVQLAETLGTQLVVDNKTSTPLIVMAEDGKPFLRIQANRVEANVRHQTWLDSYYPGGLPHREVIDEAGDQPIWRVARSTSHWGWFDARLKPDAAKSDTWRIPVRFGKTEAVISGKFVSAIANGLWQASWQQAPKLPTGISVMLIPGQPFGVMLTNKTNKTVEVLDEQQRPFLRLSTKGTFANTHSRLWQETAVQLALRQEQAQAWQKISDAPRFTWVEPRTLPETGTSLNHAKKWTITLLIDGKTTTLMGVSRWVKAAKRELSP